MTTSVIVAVQDKYNALTGTNFPGGVLWPIYFDGVPVVGGSGAQLRVPFVNLADQGTEPTFDTEYNAVEATTFVLTFYANSLGDCDAAAEAVKYNGHGPTWGFDFGALATLAVPFSSLQILRLSERRFAAGADQDDRRVHAAELKYRVTLVRPA